MSGFDVALSEAEICDVIFQHPIGLLIEQHRVLTCKIACQADMQICYVYLQPYMQQERFVLQAGAYLGRCNRHLQ